MHLCLVGIVSLSHCLPVMRQRFMFAFNHSVVVFFFVFSDNTLEQDCG